MVKVSPHAAISDNNYTRMLTRKSTCILSYIQAFSSVLPRMKHNPADL